MEQKPAPRKMKFAPKAPPKRVPKPEIKPEQIESEETNAQAMELLRKMNERALRKPKVDKKVPASQVAWMGGVVNSVRPNRYFDTSGGAYGSNAAAQELEYKEPWDYYSDYPITLPQRRPYAGDPEELDKEEFMQEPKNHEDSLNIAEDLGLTEDSEEQKMFLMRLPSVPLTKPDNKGRAVQIKELNEMPEGFLGKLLVYKSGAVKMKLGDVLYDVNPGLNRCAQDVMVVNTDEKNCSLVGEVFKHAVLTPDINSVLKDINNM